MKTLKFKVPGADIAAFAEGVQETLTQLGLACEYDDTSPPGIGGEVSYEVVGVGPIENEAAKAMSRIMVSESGGLDHRELYGHPISQDLAQIGRVLVGVAPVFGAAGVE